MKCFLFQWFLTSLHNILLSKCLKSRTLKSHFLIILKKLLFLKPTPPPNSVNNDKEKNPHASLISVISYPVQEIIAKKLPSKNNVNLGFRLHRHWFSQDDNFPCYPLMQFFIIILY